MLIGMTGNPAASSITEIRTEELYWVDSGVQQFLQ
jgi:hypothetical protein